MTMLTPPPTDSIVIYKGKPARVVSFDDRITIEAKGMDKLRVRLKEIELVHPGPVQTLPEPRTGGDFETAWSVVVADENLSTLNWMNLSELVFGSFDAASAIACVEETAQCRFFRLVDGLPQVVTQAEQEAVQNKLAKKTAEALTESAFIEELTRAIKKADFRSGLASDPRFAPYFAEIEAFARGKSQKCKICTKLSKMSTPQAAHNLLLTLGLWGPQINPHLDRFGCAINPPHDTALSNTFDGTRADLRNLQSWAIDSPWSHDPDDAIGWDGHSIWVHIAHPASFMNAEIENEAMARGSTLYLPELTSFMLPQCLLDACGLGLLAESPAMSIKITLDDAGALKDCELVFSTIRAQRITYEAADSAIESGNAPDLAALLEISKTRRAARMQQGAIDISLPEVKIGIQKNSSPFEVSLTKIPQFNANRLVQEMMILAGEAVAFWAFRNSIPFPYYRQEGPHSVPPASVKDQDGLAYQVALRHTLKPGNHGPTPAAHMSLGVALYAQVTSPLRRYSDLLAQSQIQAFLSGKELLSSEEILRRCSIGSLGASAANKTQRASSMHWILVYLMAHPEWKGQAVVLPFGTGRTTQIYLPDLGIESNVIAGSKPEIGSTVEVVVDSVSLPNLEITFRCIG